MYDVRAQRRPVFQVSFGEARITALQPEPGGKTSALQPAWCHIRKGAGIVCILLLEPGKIPAMALALLNLCQYLWEL